MTKTISQYKKEIMFKFKHKPIRMYLRTFGLKITQGHNWKKFKYYNDDKLKSFLDSKGNYIKVNYYNDGQLKQIKTDIRTDEDYLLEQIESFNNKNYNKDLIL